MARLLLYHLLSQAILYGLLGLSAFIAPPAIRTPLTAIYNQISQKPLLLVVLFLIAFGPWVSWMLIRKGRTWLGIGFGLLFTSCPGVAGMKILLGMIDRIGIDRIGIDTPVLILPQFIAFVFLSGLFIHFIVLAFYQWAKSTRTTY